MGSSRHRISGGSRWWYCYRGIGIVTDGFTIVGWCPYIGHILVSTLQISIGAAIHVWSGQCSGSTITYCVICSICLYFVQYHGGVVHGNGHSSCTCSCTGHTSWSNRGCCRHCVNLVINSWCCRGSRIGCHMVACRGIQARCGSPSVGYRTVGIMICRYRQLRATVLTNSGSSCKCRCFHCWMKHCHCHFLAGCGGTGLSIGVHRRCYHHRVCGIRCQSRQFQWTVCRILYCIAVFLPLIGQSSGIVVRRYRQGGVSFVTYCCGACDVVQCHLRVVHGHRYGLAVCCCTSQRSAGYRGGHRYSIVSCGGRIHIDTGNCFTTGHNCSTGDITPFISQVACWGSVKIRSQSSTFAILTDGHVFNVVQFHLRIKHCQCCCSGGCFRTVAHLGGGCHCIGVCSTCKCIQCGVTLGISQRVSTGIGPFVCHSTIYVRGLGSESSCCSSTDGLVRNAAHRHCRVIHCDGDGLHRGGCTFTHMGSSCHRISGGNWWWYSYRRIGIATDSLIIVGWSPFVSHVLAILSQIIGIRAVVIIGGGQCSGSTITYCVICSVWSNFVQYHSGVVHGNGNGIRSRTSILILNVHRKGVGALHFVCDAVVFNIAAADSRPLVGYCAYAMGGSSGKGHFITRTYNCRISRSTHTQFLRHCNGKGFHCSLIAMATVHSRDGNRMFSRTLSQRRTCGRWLTQNHIGTSLIHSNKIRRSQIVGNYIVAVSTRYQFRYIIFINRERWNTLIFNGNYSRLCHRCGTTIIICHRNSNIIALATSRRQSISCRIIIYRSCHQITIPEIVKWSGGSASCGSL